MNFLKALKEDIKIEMKLLQAYEHSETLSATGRLNCKTIRGNPEFYEILEGEQAKHIHPKDLEKIIQLRTKGFIKKSIKILKKNLKQQRKLLESYQSYELREIEKKLVDAYNEEKLEKWLQRHYIQNPYHREHKKYMTSFGLLVRSKTEMIIAELLQAAGIPFHYDEEVVLFDAEGNEHVFYVDFVIMTPSGKRLYWEHFGLFDQETYREKSFRKIKVFYDNGIVLSENLIITMEAEQNGLSIPSIERVIKGQVLPYFEDCIL